MAFVTWGPWPSNLEITYHKIKQKIQFFSVALALDNHIQDSLVKVNSKT